MRHISRFANPLLVTRAVLFCLSVCACVLVPALLEARDRPGTPNEIQVWSPRTLDRGPIVALMFHNTASEEVNFWVDWTINGQTHSNEDYWSRVTCGVNYVALGYMTARHDISCTGQTEASPYGNQVVLRETYTKSDEPADQQHKLFVIGDAEWHTRYCFRVKARKKSNGVVSENWSEWQCTVSGDPPPKPPAPRTPDLDYYPSNDLCAYIDQRSLPCVVIRWNPAGQTAAQAAYAKDWPGGPNLVHSYIVQYRTNNSEPWAVADNHGGVAPPGYELPKKTLQYVITFDPNHPPNFSNNIWYRVCAGNISGWSCSQPKKLIPGVSKSVQETSFAALIPPVIMQPFNGQSLPATAGVLRIKSIRGAENTTLEIEMTHLASKTVKKYPVRASELISGKPLSELTTIGGGQFRARVHVLYPKDGPWSDPVTFNIQPTARKVMTRH